LEYNQQQRASLFALTSCDNIPVLVYGILSFLTSVTPFLKGAKHNVYMNSARTKNMKKSCLKFQVSWFTGAGHGVVLLVIAIITAVLVAGCTIPGTVSSSKGSTAVTVAPTPWSGSWDSDWGIMVFNQNGDQVTGTYTHDNGKIKGTVSGNTLTGTWSEAPSYNSPNDAGDVVITLAADGNSFNGNWRYGSGTGKWDGTWDATRK
jgi:hypothetical protein